MEVYGIPMLPATCTSSQCRFIISPTSVVVVVFPFVPVMAMTFPFANRKASSTSPQISTPRLRSVSATGASTGIPGLNTAMEHCAASFSLNVPAIRGTPQSFSDFAAISASVRCSFPSYNTISIPCSTNNSAAAIPLNPVPATSTFFPFVSITDSSCFFYTFFRRKYPMDHNPIYARVSDQPPSSKW